MATTKLATLLIRTVAKPISTSLKHQASQHPRFRAFCVELAQKLYRAEIRLRTNILGGPAVHVRPLSEERAVENGANALAEGFLFGVTALLIIGETWRTSRNESRRREDVNDQLEELGTTVKELTTRVDGLAKIWEDELQQEKRRTNELGHILERVVQIGLRHSWTELQGTPLRMPHLQLRSEPPEPDRPTPDEPTYSVEEDLSVSGLVNKTDAT